MRLTERICYLCLREKKPFWKVSSGVGIRGGGGGGGGGSIRGFYSINVIWLFKSF